MDTAVSSLLKKPWVIPTFVGITTFACGAGVGYFVGTRRRKTDIHFIEKDPQMSMFDEEGQPYVRLIEPNKFNEVSSTESTMHVYIQEPEDGEAVEILTDEPEEEEEEDELAYAPTGVKNLVVEPSEVRHNVFDRSDPSWKWEVELANREAHPRAPYVITFAEFDTCESEYSQETLTYYARDDIVADQSDTPIYGADKILGPLKFGHGSRDNNVVYIRNDELEIEWEVVRHPGSFEEEVLGFEIEEQYEVDDLKHSRNDKFRMD